MERLFSRAFKYSLVIGLLLLVSMAGSAYYTFFIFPREPLIAQSVVLYIKPGMPLKKIIKQLRARGALNDFQAHLLESWIQLKGVQKSLQAGEYALPLDLTPQLLLKKWMKGEVVQHPITFREGITFVEMREIISAHPVIQTTLGIVKEEEGNESEGLLFPDTYYVVRGTTDVALLQRARKMMQAHLQKAWENRSPTSSALKSPYEVLILASIIEKEAGNESEKNLISGVFHRRLAKNMPLQADPCVIYGLKASFKGDLTRAHLKQDTPYNTYLRTGLPPTPIALAGLKSIEAALHPDEGQALYFVSKGDGTHYFSETLAEHNRAVAKYQKGENNGEIHCCGGD